MSATSITKRHIIFVSLVLIFVAILSTEARAVTYGFGAITDNSPVVEDVATQLTLDVTLDSGRVLFTFTNDGPISSSITDLYFEDGEFIDFYQFINDPDDVVFAEGASPGHLPGSDLMGTSIFFSADSDSPVQPKGVNPGESLGLLFDLKHTYTFADITTAIEKGFTGPDISLYDGEGNVTYYGTTLRIGMHVQSLPDEWGDPEESDGFIVTPIPPSVIIGMLGIGMAGIKLRKYA